MHSACMDIPIPSDLIGKEVAGAWEVHLPCRKEGSDSGSGCDPTKRATRGFSAQKGPTISHLIRSNPLMYVRYCLP